MLLHPTPSPASVSFRMSFLTGGNFSSLMRICVCSISVVPIPTPVPERRYAYRPLKWQAGPPREFAGPRANIPWGPHDIIIFKLYPTRP